MTAVLDARIKAVLRRAAVRATRAPSVHNTQPWRLHIASGELQMYLDPSRQLQALDPTGRQLVISCGCALMNARLSIAAQGLAADVERFPAPGQPELFARIRVGALAGRAAAGFAALDHVVELRQTNRRRFADEAVPVEGVEALRGAAAAGPGRLVVVEREEHRLAVARLSQKADQIENLNPAYRAEIRA